VAVPHTAQQPAVLTEVGVIVNRESAQMLAMPEARENLSQAIAEGFSTCLTCRSEAQ
jgi:N-acetylmuramoyl-L-alanine amidase